ncbi:hypothetical protein NEOC65_001571 [Neochlamydia sp. AcF65]|nr:hypothetical protein [Neochlamydia sp. AcF65]
MRLKLAPVVFDYGCGQESCLNWCKNILSNLKPKDKK